MKSNILIVDDSALLRRVECDIINQTINYRQLIHVRMDWKHLKSSVHKSTMLLFLI